MALGIQELIGEKRENILAIAEKYGIENVRVFGSVARNEAHSDSDIDFLVDTGTQTTIWDLVAIWQELEQLLECPVNVVAEDDQDEQFMQSALRDAVPL